jgi:cysteinyl-tRNA synthetase
LKKGWHWRKTWCLALEASEKGHAKLMEAVSYLNIAEAGKASTFDVKAWIQSCYDAMNDDFNTPIVISQLFEAVKVINQIKEQKASLTSEDLFDFKQAINAFVFDVLGLMNEASKESSIKINGVILCP